MWVALLLNAVLLVALLVVAAGIATTEDGWAVVAMFVLLALAGATAGKRSRSRRRRRETQRGDRLARLVSRLCMTADMAEPAVELVADEAPLSWTTALPFRSPRVHVTTGMVACCAAASSRPIAARRC
jgi:Zn-dependent protease with chaperone function